MRGLSSGDGEVVGFVHWMASPEYHQASYFGSPDYQPAFLPPYDLTGCSLRVCTPFCPYWCSQIPPPPPFAFLGRQSDPNLSPLVIAIIGILASAFLLVSYYTVVAKYCTRSGPFGRRPQGEENDSSDDQQSPPNESWPLVTVGLEESVIRSIPVCKYKRGEGLVEGTDCSVCLSEFQEDESLRLLPKCSHAFHLPCIDTWLQSHSNCPLCRANIVSPAAPPPAETIVTIPAGAPDSTGVSESQNGNNSEQNVREGPRSNSWDGVRTPANENDGNLCMDRKEEIERMESGRQLLAELTPSHVRALSDLASKHRRDDSMVELREELQPIRRSVSMDSSHRICISIADLLAMHQDFDDNNASALERPHVTCSGSSERKNLGREEFVFKGCNKHLYGCQNKSKGMGDVSKNGVLHNLKGPLTMKRSFSGGKFFFSRNNRGRNAILPI